LPNRTPASTETPGKTSIVHLLGALYRSESYPRSDVVPQSRA